MVIVKALMIKSFDNSDMLRTIIAAKANNCKTNCSESVNENLQNMTMEQLVDILAQKTQKFTQLMVYKDFGNEYKECKNAIQQILTEIEIRKETRVQQGQATSA